MAVDTTKPQRCDQKTPCSRSSQQGVLLINLGTPDSPHPKDVKRYLTEFLLDPRVIDSPYFTRQFLVRGLIIPARYKACAKSYQNIWTKQGSPLKVYGEGLCTLVQERLGPRYRVELAMRYRTPSIAQALDRLKNCAEIILLPLFPQYASATTGSIMEAVFKELSKWQTVPSLRCITSFYNHPLFIDAFCARAKTFPLHTYDHILFSFHGLPERQLKKAHATCLCNQTCCRTLNSENQSCYGAQCHETARLIANQLQIDEESYTVTFQSRLGKEPWISPYTAETIEQLAKKGIKKLLVFSPAFVADCLETLFEIEQEYAAHFKHLGGHQLDLVPSLNDHPLWVEAMASLIKGSLF